MLRQRDDHRRRDERARELVLLVQRQELLEIESRHRHDPDAGPQARVHEHLHAVDVKEREHRDEAVVLLKRNHGKGLLGVRDEVAVREHHALRQTRRARGVGQHDDVVEVDGHLVHERRGIDG